MRLLFFLLIYTYSASAFAQNFEITLHARVDTTQPEIKAIVNLWSNYLHSKPEKISDNPFWNTVEKTKYVDFDLSRKFLYQMPSDELLNYYKPTILSIAKEGENYTIRTLFAADGLDGNYRKSNPWCITKLYAVKENGEWKLKNALPIITEKWVRKTLGKITFVYPPTHVFNEALAQQSVEFCNQIISKFDLPDFQPFDFYIVDNPDEMGKLINFDFYFVGYTTGMGMGDRRILLTGLKSEYYPHELVHLIVPTFDRHPLIEEGFATWHGGTMGKNFEENTSDLAEFVQKNGKISFKGVLEKNEGWQVSAFYTTGAILCKAAYEKGGVDYINTLLSIQDNDNELIETICKLFSIKKEEIDTFWKNEIAKYR